MKNLLVPTDFSECADNAVAAALSLARVFEAKVHLFHVTEVPAKGAKEEADVLRQQKQLQAIFDQHPELDITIFQATGVLHKAIDDYLGKHGIDLIVMGSHGASGKSQYFIGSNTQKVVRTVHCPILVIKNRLEEVNFSRVVFASSFNEKEREPFLRFREFVKPFIPEIHLVMVHTSSFFDPPYVFSKEVMEDFKALCHPFPCKTHVFSDYSIDRGIRAFTREIDAQLIGISNYHRQPLRRLLVGSNVEAIINHAEIPVLSIDFTEEQ